MRTDLQRFNCAVERDPAIDVWMKKHARELGTIAHHYMELVTSPESLFYKHVNLQLCQNPLDGFVIGSIPDLHLIPAMY